MCGKEVEVRDLYSVKIHPVCIGYNEPQPHWSVCVGCADKIKYQMARRQDD